jgi:transposase
MQTILNFGGDVDSRCIVIACAERSCGPQRIANQREAIDTWLRQVPRGSRLGIESTGGYHELLADRAHAAGLQVFVLNPRLLHRYAQGVGQRGKTDRLDAETIARYVAHEHAALHAYVPLTEEQRALARLLKRRGKVVTARVMVTQSLRGVPGIGDELSQVLACFDRLIGRIDTLIEGTLRQLPRAHHAAHQIATIPGFGALGSACLGHTLTRVPYANGDAVIAQTGLDPRPDDSGQRHGRRRLSKRGPSEQRRLLFNCARAAARTHTWRPYYQAQLAKGLSATAATVVLARKMVRVAFALVKQDQPFDAERIYTHACQEP